jgi:MFS family permease
MNASVADYAKRTRQYWWIDGLVEMGFGVQLWILALFDLSIEHFESLGQGMAAGVVGMLLVLAGFLAVNKLVQWLKTRITFPRTGYVRYPIKPDSSRWRRFFVAMAIGAVTSILVNLSIVYLGQAAQWTVISLIMMASMIYVAYFTGVKRYYAMGILAFMWGIGMNWIPFRVGSLYPWFFGGAGSIFMITGLIVFLLYLRRYPTNEGDEDAG